MIVFKWDSFPVSLHSALYQYSDRGCAKVGDWGEGLGG